ncbi:serine peptidase [Candidatus Aerophobetes bacterium]|uniref:Serine peptidase n=1 Tax=Aerophobetes bacterium TaxID=2030807 RepID=A0A2A4YKQ6_UNCAE|nr:MAG: serine peptidase [Candidatus Aerophobetes bacterium]
MKKALSIICGCALIFAFSTSAFALPAAIEKVLFSKSKEEEKTVASSCSSCGSKGKSIAKQLSRAFTQTAKKAIPSVVFIRVEASYENEAYSEDPYGFFNDEFFNRFFGKPSKPQKPQAQISQGSGFIVSKDGYIMTNYHVVANAKQMTVVLQNGDNNEYTATLVGGDPQTDVAVIKISHPDGRTFPYLDFGDSEEVEVGEWVVAVGNPFQLEASVTVGVISAKGRQNLKITELEDFIQTDAAINPGNSGGPLLDLDGDVIGINTAIVSRSGGYMGIGFAIPSNMAQNVYRQIVDKGSVSRGFLGVSLQPIDKDLAEALNMDRAEGALVADVVEDSPASRAGVKQGDVILEVGGNLIKSPANIRNEVMLNEPGKVVTLKINRKGKIVLLQVTLGSYSKSSQMMSENAQLLGITVENLSSENIKRFNLVTNDEGVVITDVKQGSMGAKIGLKPGFIVLSLNQKKINNVSDFNEALGSIEKGKKVLILVKHGDMARFFSLTMN